MRHRPQPPPCERDPAIKAVLRLLYIYMCTSVRIYVRVLVCVCACCQTVLVIILDRRNYRLLQKRACGCSTQSCAALKGLQLSKRQPIIPTAAQSCLLKLANTANREVSAPSFRTCYFLRQIIKVKNTQTGFWHPLTEPETFIYTGHTINPYISHGYGTKQDHTGDI